MTIPEINEIPKVTEDLKPPEIGGEIPEVVEKGQMVQQQPQPIPRTTITATVTTAQPTSVPTVTIPADPAQLTSLAKGNPTNAITWFANFWLRIIKKALAIGSGIMTSQSIKIPAAGTDLPAAATPTAPQTLADNSAVTSDATDQNTTPETESESSANNQPV